MNNPRTVEDVIVDFKGRRLGILKALTKEVQSFYDLCDPSYPNLCLFGHPNHRWEVNLPPPSDLPEPRLGINFSRDSMKREDWLTMVALHSDAWLHAMVSYFAAKFQFDKADRKRLFNKIADFSSISEILARTRTSGSKRARVEYYGLPEEMLIEVLARVSVRDLVKFRLVSKSWRSLIDDQEFVSTHLKKYRNNLEGNHLLVMEIPRSYLRDEQLLVRRSDTFRKVLSLEFIVGHRSSYFLSYVNGLLLVKNGNSQWLREIVLWNPSINRSLTLPDSVIQSMKEASYFELGLGFDELHSEYKVIGIVYPQATMSFPTTHRRYHGIISGLVQVYTLSTNSWSTLIGVEPPTYWSVGKQVFLNGAIHWTNLGPKIEADDATWQIMKDSHVVSFDVANEIFNYFELPSGNDFDHVEYIRESFLTIFEGSLAIFRSFELHNDIWVMKEYGAAESWCKAYTFTLEIENLFYFKSNGELVYAIEGKGVMEYDVKKASSRHVAKTYCRTSKYIAHTYVESLVLLHEQKQILDNKKVQGITLAN